MCKHKYFQNTRAGILVVSVTRMLDLRKDYEIYTCQEGQGERSDLDNAMWNQPHYNKMNEIEQMTRHKKKVRRIDNILIILVSMLLAGTLLGTIYCMNRLIIQSLARPFQVVFTVGDYVGSSIYNVEKLLKAQNFETYSISYVKSNEFMSGIVISQSMDVGSVINDNMIQTLDLVVSQAKNTITLPDYTEIDFECAQKELEQMGLIVSICPESNNLVSNNKVIRTNPEAGASVLPNSEVTLFISQKKSSTSVTESYWDQKPAQESESTPSETTVILVTPEPSQEQTPTPAPTPTPIPTPTPTPTPMSTLTLTPTLTT